MLRMSFRQSLLAGFLLLASLLAWAAVSGWMILEQFVDQGRRTSQQALQLSASIQELADRSIDIERGVRQFAVLGDPALLGRFDENVTHALTAVRRLESLPGSALGRLPGDWRQALEALADGLHQAAPITELRPLLRRLAEINSELGRDGRRWIEQQNTVLLESLNDGRRQLTTLVVAAVAAAFAIALTLSWWLSRPIGSLMRAIERLGAGCFGEPVSVAGAADLQRVGRQLDWLRQRLDDVENERERTLRHVSHELKTPLTALREGIALLQEQVPGPLAEGQQEVVDILQHNVMALQEQIEGLLRLNAACAEARRSSRRPLVLRQLLTDVVRARDLQIQARQLTVVHEAPAVTRLLDQEKLLVAVDNLLSNAIDFSPDHGVIRLEAATAGKNVRISCIDQGPGIAGEDAERIFEPFVQGRRPSPTPRRGSGVGLSIVRELITAMGGRVWLVPERSANLGAHFRIEVPCE